MSSTICILPILAALFGANDFNKIDNHIHWNTVNSEQKILVEQHWQNHTDLDLFKNGEITSKASNNASDVNQFLKDHNFQIQLTDLHDPLAFYVASILNIALEWEKEGDTQKMDGGTCTQPFTYDAVIFDKNNGQTFKVYKLTTDYSRLNEYNISRFFSSLPSHSKHRLNETLRNDYDFVDSEILEVKAKNGDTVYMMPILDQYAIYGIAGTGCNPVVRGRISKHKQFDTANFELLETITEKWQKSIVSENEISDYDQAIFPKVSIDQEVDISWLVGLQACTLACREIRGYPAACLAPQYTIAQALQQTKFEMDEKGAKVESAAAISGLMTMCEPHDKKIFTINKPFYLWIMRPGMQTPIFAAVINYDSWKGYSKMPGIMF